MYIKMSQLCAIKLLNNKSNMKKVMTAAAALFISVASFAQTTWTLDKSHAKLGFSVTHMLISEVEGSFRDFDAKFTASKDDLTDAKIELTAQVASVNTDNADRDKHLQAPDYFDAAKYPTITFKGKAFKKVGEKDYKLSGDLTMHGVTKAIELDVVFFGTAVHPYTKKTVGGFKVTGTLNRKDFGVGADTPSAALSDEIQIRANVEFVKG